MKDWWKWMEGRQGSGYWKFKIFESKLLKCDFYLLKYPTGSYIDWHVDPSVYGYRHWRMNIIIWESQGGRFETMKGGLHPHLDGINLIQTRFVNIFNPDIVEHRVTEVIKGTRYALSFGWLTKLKTEVTPVLQTTTIESQKTKGKTMNNATSQVGKAGTILPEEFTQLSEATAQYTKGGVNGALLLASKVAKICAKKSAALKHEFPGSTVAAAYDGIVNKINGVTGNLQGTITTDLFGDLTGMVAKYGPEVVIWKLAKIAKKNNYGTISTSLSGLFPSGVKAKAATVAAPAARRTGRTYPRF